jgi:hypothetical protein
MREPSWREVARLLAERLQYHAQLAGSADPYLPGTGCGHKLEEEDPANCPFCADRAAFNTYARKVFAMNLKGKRR